MYVYALETICNNKQTRSKQHVNKTRIVLENLCWSSGTFGLFQYTRCKSGFSFVKCQIYIHFQRFVLLVIHLRRAFGHVRRVNRGFIRKVLGKQIVCIVLKGQPRSRLVHLIAQVRSCCSIYVFGRFKQISFLHVCDTFCSNTLSPLIYFQVLTF